MNKELQDWQTRNICGMEPTDDGEAEVRRRVWRRRWRTIGDIIGSLILVALMWAFGWLCCAASGYHFE